MNPQVDGNGTNGYTMKWDPTKVVSFQTGAIREAKQGKGRYDLISPFVLQRLALIMEIGGRQKGDRNWEKGIPLWSYVDSATRHLQQWLMGLDDEDHLGQALWNIHCLIHTQEMIERGLLPDNLAEGLPRYLSNKGDKECSTP